MNHHQHVVDNMNYCAVYTLSPDKHQYFITWEIMCNLFLWCWGCLIKLKAAVSGQWPGTLPDETFCHISLICNLCSVTCSNWFWTAHLCGICGAPESALSFLDINTFALAVNQLKNSFCGNNLIMWVWLWGYHLKWSWCYISVGNYKRTRKQTTVQKVKFSCLIAALHNNSFVTHD